MLQLTICLDSGGEKPLYQQLYESLAAQIRSGVLQAGDRLPGKRSLAGQLAVAVNTVDTAYQMLAAEGYLEARQRSGFFVLASGGFPAVAEPAAPRLDSRRDQSDCEDPPPRFDLSTGGVDTALFPFRTWGKIQRDLLYGEPELLRHGHRQGDEELRRELAEYLRAYRGVDCGVEQIVVGAGVEYLLGLAARLLGPVTAAVENPGYDRSRTILENNGIPCRCVAWRGWSRAGRTSAMSPPATTSLPPSPCPPPAAPSCCGGPRPGRGAASWRTTTTRSFASTPGPCPASRAWGAGGAR